MSDTQADIKQLFSDASPEAQKLIKEVSKPIGIVEQILSTVKDVVR